MFHNLHILQTKTSRDTCNTNFQRKTKVLSSHINTITIAVSNITQDKTKTSTEQEIIQPFTQRTLYTLPSPRALWKGIKYFWGELEAQRVISQISNQISLTIVHFNDVMNQ